LLCEDIKEAEAKNEDLERRVKDLEAKVEGERSKGHEYARRGLSLRAENGRSKNFLSGMKELSRRGQPHDSSNDDKLSMGQRAAQDGSTGMKYSRIQCLYPMGEYPK
jgi:hypothetical protein